MLGGRESKGKVRDVVGSGEEKRASPTLFAEKPFVARVLRNLWLGV